jgi:mannitol/fructose-specific phosphotransferase system IIA component (Ntr-type)
MRMSDFVVREAIVPDLNAETKEGVIREMVESLRAAGQFRGADLEDIVRAILRRELLGSTGIGRGVAIPHTKHSSVERLIGTVAISRKGVSFQSLDGEPVYVFVLLISPQDRPGDHLRALENVSRCLRDDAFVKALRQATTREAIFALLERMDHQL